MGNAGIFWYPTDANEVETIDLGEGLSDLQAQVVTLGPQERSVIGENHTATWSAFHQVRVVLERFTDPARIRALLSLEAHLKRGGFIEVTADLDKAVRVAHNAKCRKFSICNALDTLLVHQDVAEGFLPVMGRS